ncbi:hypothetical protein D7Y41_02625 [Anaerotruncus sp. 1XD22-93]|nr:hypothetical protein [Lachnospiraceae bacterium]NBI74243.1 hypothetical protein [Lachnospiraceae bacterium]RKK00368.1 hypothetical protein D7Y41_02625 [Anaerotruncus sp. 1XD22-93]
MRTQVTKIDREYYREKILEKKLQLERSKVMNQELLKLNAKKDAIQQVKDDLSAYVDLLFYLKRTVLAEDTAFRERRVEYLNNVITEELQKIFPHSGLQAKIAYNDKYSRTKATLRLVDSDGYSRKPKIAEGKLCQYLISFAAVNGVVRSLGYSNIYVDEAFGVSSPENLPRVGESLQQSIDSGMQIVLVSQNPALYESIPRQEIHLRHEPADGRTVIDNIAEY